MRNFQKRGGFKYFIQSKPILIILTIIVIFFAWNIFGLIVKFDNTYKNKKIEQKKIEDLQKRKEKLIYDIGKLDTNEGKEEIIRENFGMVKEGEQLIVIVDDKKVLEEKKSESFGIITFFKNLFNK